MGSKLGLEDKGNVKIFNGKRHHCMISRPDKPCSCSGSRCREKLVEFLCSCCLLCVCCPLATVYCCIKLPCRFLHKALRIAWQWTCYGSRNKIFADYSSFSDIDSDVTFGKVKPSVAEDRFHSLMRE